MTELSADTFFPEASSFYVPVAGSTMDEARTLSTGRPRGLVRAGRQTAGRGRLPGRVWHGQSDESLLVTFWLPLDSFGTAPPPLLAGLAVRRACDAWARAAGAILGHGVELKWPNDVLCGGRKLAGVLCESGGGTVYIGIGINCSQPGFEGDFRTEPTSLLVETGKAAEPADLLKCLTDAMIEVLCLGDTWRSEYEACLAWRGKPVMFSPGIEEASTRGTLDGIDVTGAVIVSGRPWPSGELKLVIDEGAWT
ncbi:MAG: hypothetical protein CVV51_11615 [Spirochaetae bacterium HGW-Spirochaetae-7]|jgi:BirA family biotin operon repressor/biotin-[acetyl-CoA-carboxylase] ligase|nr:MAG: hypothetical protein CVV51_11615 [Spirochaetae bacterium HGW-Spirochaetae-7]